MDLTREEFEQILDTKLEEKLDQKLDQKLDEKLKNFATKDDIKNLATKDDLVMFATKDDLVAFATKDDLVMLATRDDLLRFATKDDLLTFATKDDLLVMGAGFETKLATGLERLDRKIDAVKIELKEYTDTQVDNLAKIIAETVAVPLKRHIEQCENIRLLK